MISADNTRALAHIAVNRLECKTPYFLADLHSLLVQRHQYATLLRCNASYAELNVFGHPVELHYNEGTMIVKGRRTIHVPTTTIDTFPICAVYDDKEVCLWDNFVWSKQWPWCESMNEFLNNRVRDDVSWKSAPLQYMSEVAVADAIIAAC